MRAALLRGFAAAVQTFDASNIALTLMVPKTMNRLGLNHLTGGIDRMAARISKWEDMYQDNDIDPANPSKWKKALAFLLYNTTYLAPIIGAGFAIQLLAGPVAGMIAIGLLNTHSMLGEAMMQTARKHELDLKDAQSVSVALRSDGFGKTARNNALIKGGICGAFTLAAGPIARLLGNFTGDIFRAVSRTAFGNALSDQFLKTAERSLLKSASKSIGRFFANAAIGNGYGPAAAFAKVVGTIGFSRAATELVYDNVANQNEKPPEEKEAGAEQPRPIPHYYI